VIRRSGIYALIPFSVWVACMSLLIGAVASLVGNPAPIQLAAIVWGQSLAIVLYAKYSPVMLSLYYSAAYMSLATLIIWGISIAAFVVQKDWISAVAILCVSAGCVVWNTLQIWLCEEHRDYNLGWDDGVLSIVQFYGSPW